MKDNNEHLKKLYQINQAAMDFFKWAFGHIEYGKSARDYIRDKNPLKGETEELSVGFALNSWDSLFIYLQKKGFLPEEIINSGLIKERSDGNYFDLLRNRIIFPIQNENGQIIAFGGRALDQNQEGYITSDLTLIFTQEQQLDALKSPPF
jgi:DNA primase